MTLESSLGSLSVGQCLGGYELLAPIARGGMAIVWAARKAGTNEPGASFAVKTLLPALSHDARFERMFSAEARLAAKLRHPNVCSVFDSGEDRGTLYLVMEWIEGESLATVAADAGGPLPLGVAAQIALDVARGLAAAHELCDEEGGALQIVHRDVSPQNIMVTPMGTAKIVDFGVAKSYAADERLTQSGYLKGKVGYMSPEQVYCERVDGRTDVFALGVVLYEASTGKHPFAAGAPLGTLVNISNPEPAAPPETVLPDYPERLSVLVMKAINKDVERRFSNMRELAAALEGALVELEAGSETVRDYFSKTSGYRQPARAKALLRFAERSSEPSLRALTSKVRSSERASRTRTALRAVFVAGLMSIAVALAWLGARRSVPVQAARFQRPLSNAPIGASEAQPAAASAAAPTPVPTGAESAAEPVPLAQRPASRVGPPPHAARAPARTRQTSVPASDSRRSLDDVLKTRE